MPGNIIPDFMVAVKNGTTTDLLLGIRPRGGLGDSQSFQFESNHREFATECLLNVFVAFSPLPLFHQPKKAVEKEVTVDSDIPKMFADYKAEDHDALDFVPKSFFESILTQIFVYMTYDVSAYALRLRKGI